MNPKSLIGRLFFYERPKAFLKIIGIVPPEEGMPDGRMKTIDLFDQEESESHFLGSFETGEYILLPEGFSEEKVKAYYEAKGTIEKIHDEIYFPEK